jgi:hypothetical protein
MLVEYFWIFSSPFAFRLASEEGGVWWLMVVMVTEFVEDNCARNGSRVCAGVCWGQHPQRVLCASKRANEQSCGTNMNLLSSDVCTGVHQLEYFQTRQFNRVPPRPLVARALAIFGVCVCVVGVGVCGG